MANDRGSKNREQGHWDEAANENAGGEGAAREGLGSGLLGETLKKILSVGLGAAFMTEESVRAYLADMKLPKDVLNGLLQSAAKSKTELMNRVGSEVIRMVSKIDFVKEASRFAEEHKFRIHAEVEVIRKEKLVDADKADTNEIEISVK